jgi:hypothetical protein
MPSRGGNVYGGVGRAGAHKEPEAGQPLQDLGGESCPLPHGHEHVEPGEGADRVVAIGERLVKTTTSAGSESQSARLDATFW